jgi:hypothetical protein
VADSRDYPPKLLSLPRIDLLPILNNSFSRSRTGGLSEAFRMKYSGASGLLLGEVKADAESEPDETDA